MFQVEPVLWLQSFASTPLTAFFWAVTLLGYLPVYAALLLTLAFAFRLRPSLGVLGGVLVAGLLSEGLKDAVAYPRPDEIDARVKKTVVATPIELAERGGARSFWATPQSHAIAAVRRRAAGNYGFPSGHVSAATSFLLCAAFFFRSRRPALLAAAWVPLMALSRMYLGRHFLADVLGGFAIGLVASGLAVLLFRAFDEELFGRTDRRARSAILPATLVSLLPATLVSLLLVLITPHQPLLDPVYVGALAGLVLSYGFLLVTGLPRDAGTKRQRLLRVAVATLVFLAGITAMGALTELLGRPSRLTPLVASTIASGATFAGTVWLSRRLGLYPAA